MNRRHLAGFPAVLLIAGALVGTPAARQVPDPPVSFEAFVDGLRTEARARGITAATIESALGTLTPEPVVVSRDRSQPELTQSLDAYVARRLTPRTITTAREALRSQRTLLTRMARVYGVPPPVLVAIWGIESNFGRFTGTYSTVRSLATLAYDARRPLFRDELFDALAIIDRGDASAEGLKGSWAGAMGQPQFMPSSFLAYAIDHDGDGRADIWQSRADVFASMANYLKQKGWTAGERWGREVRVSRAAMTRIDRGVAMRAEGCRAVRELTAPRPLAEWQALGVRLPGGQALPAAGMTASLVRGEARHFLVYRNFEAILDYNCSNAYAVTVALLSDRIAGAK
jgi:membrane-bound lytic murein transglycosylase B